MPETLPLTDAEVKAQYGGLAGTQPVAPTSFTPKVEQVLSPANVAQTMTAPTGPYDYSDPLKIQDRIRAELGLGDVQKQYQDAVANLRSFDTGTTTQQFNIDQELNPMGVIRGEQATALGQRSLSRQGLADVAQALADRYNALETQATNKFNILNTERQNLQQLMVSNPGAKISYTDTIESANRKIAKYTEKAQKEAEKDAYKKSLKAAALQLGIKTAGSTKEIEKRLKKYYGDQATYNLQIQQLELQAKRQAIAQSGAGSGTTANTALNSLLEKAAKMESGGREWAVRVAPSYGISADKIKAVTNQNGWEAAFKTNAPTKTTQAQAVASGYAQRAKEANSILNNYDTLGAELIGKVTGGEYFPTFLKSSDRQKMEQAQRNFVNAVLRPESGAVISDQEFKNAAQQYFPQPGESQGVIDQKRANRETKINNLYTMAGENNVAGEQDVRDILSQFGL